MVTKTVVMNQCSEKTRVMSQFLNSPHDSHWNTIIQTLRRIKGMSGQGLVYMDKGQTNTIGCPMQIEQVMLEIGDHLQVIVFLLKKT